MDIPTAEIVCLGNELLIGVTSNTNATFLGSHLTKVGFEVRRITCIRDDIALAAEFLQEVFERKPDLILISGGLGPTYDDIQLEVLSNATGLKLEENEILTDINILNIPRLVDPDNLGCLSARCWYSGLGRSQ